LSATAVAPASPAVPVVPTTPLPAAPADPTSPNSDGSASSPSTSTGNGVTAQTAAIAAKVDPSVVDINTVLQGGSGAGTGLILTSSGEILTNNHVIDGATSITVTFVSTGRAYKATVIGTDPTQDVAVIQVPGVSGLTPIQTGSSSAVAVGDAVVALGNAGGAGGTPSAVTGTVQAVNQTITASDLNGANAETLNGLIQTNAPIQPGDSGGPLVNAAGQVIGIDTAASSGRRFSAGSSVGFAIPIDQAVGIAHQIESGHATATIHIGLPAFLGVAIQPTGAGQNGSNARSSGAVVSAVEPGLPAAAIGLVAGDTITSIGGQPVTSPQTLPT
jgi:S1-C subfamily serine protease